VDVLVQFFQSSESSSNGEYGAILSMDCTFSLLPDAPGEVAVVKTVLIQHLELDSEVILSILCHQIIHPGDPMKDGDRAIRERPHGLVVAFLAEDAREPLLAQLRSQDDSDAARSGRDTGRHATRGDARSVIVFLPPPSTATTHNDYGCARPNRRRGNELLRTLLERVASSLKEDLAPGPNPASLDTPVSTPSCRTSRTERGTRRTLNSSCASSVRRCSWAR